LSIADAFVAQAVRLVFFSSLSARFFFRGLSMPRVDQGRCTFWCAGQPAFFCLFGQRAPSFLFFCVTPSSVPCGRRRLSTLATLPPRSSFLDPFQAGPLGLSYCAMTGPAALPLPPFPSFWAFEVVFPVSALPGHDRQVYFGILLSSVFLYLRNETARLLPRPQFAHKRAEIRDGKTLFLSRFIIRSRSSVVALVEDLKEEEGFF